MFRFINFENVWFKIASENMNDIADDFIFTLKYADTVSPVSKAAAVGDLELVTSLLKGGHLPHTPDNQGWCAVHSCAATNQTEVLKLILNFKKNNKKYLTNLCTWEGETPLMLAVQNEGASVTTAKTLLESGADPRASTNEGMTALHFASKKKNNVNIVKLLVEYGANVNCKDSVHGYTPLHFAVAEAFDVDLVKYLVEISDLNETDFNLETPLYKACVYNFLQAVEFILEKDVNYVNSIPRMCISPLSAAAANGNLEIVKLLVNAGADTHFVGRIGLNRCNLYNKNFLPIHSAVVNVNVFKHLLGVTNPAVLLQHEMDVHISPLSIHSMMYASGTEFFEVLLEYPFPAGFDELRIVSFSRLTYFILHALDYDREILLQKFLKFFKYCSYFEPENVFEHFASLLSDNELIEVCDFLHLLAKLGISSVDVFESKDKVIKLLQSSVEINEKEVRSWETVSLLKQPVLSLKQISRVASRRFIRSISKSDFYAYVMIRDSSLPQNLKEFLWYQISC